MIWAHGIELTDPAPWLNGGEPVFTTGPPRSSPADPMRCPARGDAAFLQQGPQGQNVGGRLAVGAPAEAAARRPRPAAAVRPAADEADRICSLALPDLGRVDTIVS
ncbi:hypothetical protein [Streptomyces sp. NRRL B-3229]|uniref:hypothetical protein n=1 Tax=Streptomyces sp. NRRL B-3229 TaxID=1463836 RepID=UPI0004BFF922|nr:hypothetical protein [Streptomyces sp. NRRL B-3229]